jgi:Domain of unknown function (DUF4279)
MNSPNPLIDVTIYVWGDALDPADVSSCLGIEPSLSRRRGDKRTTRTHREITAKTSVWTLSTEGQGGDLSTRIQELAVKLEARSSQIYKIAGVEGAYVDIYIALSVARDGQGQCCFRLSHDDIAALQTMGLPIEFTLDVGKD